MTERRKTAKDNPKFRKYLKLIAGERSNEPYRKQSQKRQNAVTQNI